MNSNIIKCLIILLALVSLSTECTKDDEPDSSWFLSLDFTITPETGYTTTTFTFDASESSYKSPDGDKIDEIGVRWDFDCSGTGDFSWDTDWSANKIITYQYTEAGTYNVVLRGNYSREYSHLIKTVIVSTQSTPPVAYFEGNPTSGTIPLVVNFTDQSTNDPTSWQWDFGNGESSTEQNPSYTYNDEGIYTVKLTATNVHGSDIEEKIDYITVTSGSSHTPCPGVPTVTDVDGNKYNTVLIGDQCWMKENLKTTRYKDESPIPNVEDGSAWKDLFTGAYVWYENELSWREPYSALYNWYAVDDPKGLCPEGWHVSSDDEWEILISTIGGDYVYGRKIRSCSQVNSPYEECNTSEHPRWDETTVTFGSDLDEYGLSLLPGGRRHTTEYSSIFYSIGSGGYWWSSTYDFEAWNYSMNHNDPHIYFNLADKNRGYSVRCLKND